MCCIALGLLWLFQGGWPTTEAAGTVTPSAPAVAHTEAPPVVRQEVGNRYGQVPLHFEPNQGQTAAEVQFLARGPGYAVFLTPQEVVWSLRARDPAAPAPPAAAADSAAVPPPATPAAAAVVRLSFVGAAAAPPVLTGLDPQPGHSHYFIGNDPPRWHTAVPHYGQVRYAGLYPGIDLVLYGNPQQLEYDFVVAPGADPGQIRLAFQGVEALRVDPDGRLVLQAPGGELIHQAPVIYQRIAGERRPVAGRYVLREPVPADAATTPATGGLATVGFQVAAYDTTTPLVIDPRLVYSTYLGGSKADEGTRIAVDAAGQAYVTGYTQSTNFPTANALQLNNKGLDDVFVTKLDATGQILLYSTYLGGSKADKGFGIAVDAAGQAYVTGYTFSDNFPTTANALQPALGGSGDAFVTKLNTSGSLLYSTYLGGSGDDEGYAIAVDTVGQAYVTGRTDSDDFPTANAWQSSRGGSQDGSLARDAFVTKLSADGTTLVYSTYLGGSGDEEGWGIAVDTTGQAYVTGFTSPDTSPNSTPFPTTANAWQRNPGGDFDAFVTKLAATGRTLVYSTYLAGSGYDVGYGIAVDAANQAYVTGSTLSVDFPTAPPLQHNPGDYLDAFVTKLAATGQSLVYSRYLGGSANDVGYGIAVDAAGQAYVTGYTNSTDFPTANALYPTFAGGLNDAFVTKLDATGQTLVSTYLGGSANDVGSGIAVDTTNQAYVTGKTNSTDFPTTNALQSTFAGGLNDVFVVQISSNLGKVTLIAPTGTITTTTPTYRWNAVPDVTWYYLWVNDASGNRIQQWYTAAQVGCASGTGECAVNPGVALQAGTGQWWVQTYSAGGYDPWSDAMSFTVGPVLIAPTSTITTPIYRWQAVPNATWYYLWVNDASGHRLDQWYTAAQVGCASGSGRCAITPAVSLRGGTGQCWVQSYSASGYGSWSDDCEIAYYRWQAVANATWYYLWVNDVSGNRIRQWYTAAQVGCASGSGECVANSGVALQAGAAQWWVQAYGATGYSPWSQGISFVVP